MVVLRRHGWVIHTDNITITVARNGFRSDGIEVGKHTIKLGFLFIVGYSTIGHFNPAVSISEYIMRQPSDTQYRFWE